MLVVASVVISPALRPSCCAASSSCAEKPKTRLSLM
jgi:hypothetical protein